MLRHLFHLIHLAWRQSLSGKQRAQCRQAAEVRRKKSSPNELSGHFLPTTQCYLRTWHPKSACYLYNPVLYHPGYDTHPYQRSLQSNTTTCSTFVTSDHRSITDDKHCMCLILVRLEIPSCTNVRFLTRDKLLCLDCLHSLLFRQIVIKSHFGKLVEDVF